jgi:hypothetical protein
MSNLIAKMALKQLVSYMKEKNMKCMKVFITENNEVDFLPIIEPEDLILKSEHEQKIQELKNYFKKLNK